MPCRRSREKAILGVESTFIVVCRTGKGDAEGTCESYLATLTSSVGLNLQRYYCEGDIGGCWFCAAESSSESL